MKPKKILLIVAVAFIIYAIYKQPTKSGNTVGDIVAVAVHGGQSVLRFFDALLR